MSKDTWQSTNYGLPSALYYYFISSDMEQNYEFLGNCSAILSIQYVPFINLDDLSFTTHPYDIKRFGSISKDRPELNSAPNVFRINNINSPVNIIGHFKCYEPRKKIGGLRDWRNESRLYNHPFSFAMITDNLNTPFEVKYHLCSANFNTLKVRNTISDRCSYGIFVEGYKNDSKGLMESMVSGDSHELPCSSSAYSQWFASSKNQTTQSVKNVQSNAFLSNATTNMNSSVNSATAVMGGIGSLINGNFGGVGNAIGGYMTNKINTNATIKQNSLNISNAISDTLAQQKDLNSTPNSMLSMGSDIYFGLAKGEKKVTLHRYGLSDTQYKKLGDYFAMFGYKQNQMMLPNISSRYYYNYIKTIGVNIRGINIPRNDLNSLKDIFNKGVTVWHIENKGVVLGDYSKDNYEV